MASAAVYASPPSLPVNSVTSWLIEWFASQLFLNSRQPPFLIVQVVVTWRRSKTAIIDFYNFLQTIHNITNDFHLFAVTPTVPTSSCWTRSTCWSENLSGFRPPGYARSKLTASTELILPSLPPQSTPVNIAAEKSKPYRVCWAPLPSLLSNPLLQSTCPSPSCIPANPPVTQSQPTCSQMPTVSTWAISLNLSELIC